MPTSQTAGEALDSTLGAALGLSTMAAAALGNLVSVGKNMGPSWMKGWVEVGEDMGPSWGEG